MIRDISVIKPEMSLQRLGLVLFCSLLINELVTANIVTLNNPVIRYKTYALILPIPRKSFYG